jgi:phosphoenolpyruvate phosphomutase
MKKNKTCYIALTADTIHHGHMKLLEKAREFGDITIGLMSDSAVHEHKRIPYLNFEQRKKILTNFKGVKKVVKQDTWDYSQYIKKYKPDYHIHGDDWKSGYQKEMRTKILTIMKSYGGKLIEVPYTKGISSSALAEQLNSLSTTKDIRRGMLKRLLISKKFLKIIEAHSPLSALVAEKISVKDKDKTIYFDGFWSSSLTDSTLMGKPDNESLDFSQRLNGIDQIFDVTTKPLIMDGDTGGKIEHFDMKIKSAERLGISAIIIEDKKGLKKNSLLENTSTQFQENKKSFAEKIKIGKKAQISEDFMIIARIESFILGKGVEDAISRAHAYINAGADAIMIHSKSKDPKEIFKFSKIFRKHYKEIPLIAVPSSYNHIKDTELQKKGFNIVIYANHLLRASYPSMVNVAKSILKNKRSKEADSMILSIKEILNLIPGTN